ncbi:SH3 domain-containing protein [Breznakiellaceae bacterium SP9]
MSDEFEKLVEDELKKSLAEDQSKTRPSRPSQRSVPDTKNVQSDEFEKLVEDELKKPLAEDQSKTRPSQRSRPPTPKMSNKDNFTKNAPSPKPSDKKASPVCVAIAVAIITVLAITGGVVVYKFILTAPANTATTAVAPVNPPTAPVNAPDEGRAAAERKAPATMAADPVISEEGRTAAEREAPSTTAIDPVIPAADPVIQTPAPAAAAAFRATHRIRTNDGSNLRLRSTPSTRGTQVDSLDNGSYVQVLETGERFVDSDGNAGNWVRIRTQNTTGWCFGAYLTALGSEEGGAAATAFRATHRIRTNDGSNLRLRSTPSTRGTQVDSLDNGSYVQVLETGERFVDSDGNAGNWVRIRTQNNKTGWCFGAYLTRL